MVDALELETIIQTPVETLSEVKSDTCELETMIIRLGEIVELPVFVPRYATFHTSIVATGKDGRAPGELFAPSGVAIHEEIHQIFVVNYFNDRVDDELVLRRISSSVSWVVGQLVCNNKR